jgi:hypothetical protein
MINLIFLLEKTDFCDEKSENSAEIALKCVKFVKRVLKNVQLGGFSCAQVSASVWVSRQVCFHDIGGMLGMNILEKEVEMMYPKELIKKPLTAVQHYIGLMNTYIKRVYDSSEVICVLPILMRSDFNVPFIVIKVSIHYNIYAILYILYIPTYYI